MPPKPYLSSMYDSYPGLGERAERVEREEFMSPTHEPYNSVYMSRLTENTRDTEATVNLIGANNNHVSEVKGRRIVVVVVVAVAVVAIEVVIEVELER